MMVLLRRSWKGWERRRGVEVRCWVERGEVEVKLMGRNNSECYREAEGAAASQLVDVETEEIANDVPGRILSREE